MLFGRLFSLEKGHMIAAWQSRDTSWRIKPDQEVNVGICVIVSKPLRLWPPTLNHFRAETGLAASPKRSALAKMCAF